MAQGRPCHRLQHRGGSRRHGQVCRRADASTANPHRYFSPERLVNYVIDAPATSGYSYSNTNYILAGMIIERVTGRSYRNQLYRRIINPLRPVRPALPPARVPLLGDQT